MSRRNAYEIYNINYVEDEVRISLDTFSRTIDDRYVSRFLNESDVIEETTALVETLIEGDYYEWKLVISDYDDLILEVIASTDWIIRCVDKMYHVDVKVQFLSKDEEFGKNHEHGELYRVNIVPKR